MSHYTLEAFSPRYALFGSRWGETLLVDRETKRSFYSQDGGEDFASLQEAFSLENDALTNSLCSDYVACGGSDEPLVPDVLADLENLKERES